MAGRLKKSRRRSPSRVPVRRFSAKSTLLATNCALRSRSFLNLQLRLCPRKTGPSREQVHENVRSKPVIYWLQKAEQDVSKRAEQDLVFLQASLRGRRGRWNKGRCVSFRRRFSVHSGRAGRWARRITSAAGSARFLLRQGNPPR